MTRVHHDRGVTIPLVALLLPVMIVMTAFAVDLGMQRSSRRTMQARADVIALDMVRVIGGRTIDAINADPTTMIALHDSAQRNGAVVDIPNGSADANAERITRIEWGRWNPATKQFELIATTLVPDAVRITGEQRTQFRFQPGSGDVTRTAVATMNAGASLRLGSFAARASTGASPFLSPLVGDAVGATGGGYEGLEKSDVTPNELVPYLPSGSTGGGTPEEVLAAEVEVADLMRATAEALRNDPDATSDDIANATFLDDRSVTVPPGPPVRIEDIVAAEQGGEAGAVATEVNVLDLIAGAAFVANGDNAIAVPAVGFSQPGMVQSPACDSDVSNDATEVCNALKVIQAPVIIAGGVGAAGSTSQVEIRSGVGAIVPELSDAKVQLDFRLASGSATIAGILCANPKAVSSLIATGLIEVDVRITGVVTVSAPLVPDFPVPVVITATRPPSQASELADFDEQPDGSFYPPIYEAGQQDLGLDGLAFTTQVESIPPAISAGLDTIVNGTVMPHITGTILPTIENEYLIPLLNSIGANLVGADLAANAVNCALPRLASDPQPA
jgi:uncharacterized membrane protein